MQKKPKKTKNKKKQQIVQWFQDILSNKNYSIQHYLFIFSHLSCS